MKTNSTKNPIGIDTKRPVFSWKSISDKQGVKQVKYKITVAEDTDFKNIVWDSGYVLSDNSMYIEYDGIELKAMTRYYWQVETVNNYNETEKSETAYFETGLMGKDADVWNGAKWIGSPKAATNTDFLNSYAITADFAAENGSNAGIAVNARDCDNYILIEFQLDKRLVKIYEYNDNAWTTSKPTVTVRGNANGYIISEKAVPKGNEHIKNSVKIYVNPDRSVSIYINDIITAKIAECIPQFSPSQPRRQYLMNFGLKQKNSRAVYYNIKIENTQNGEVYQEDDFKDESGVLSALGTIVNKQLVVENEFHLINPCPSVNVRKVFAANKKISYARLYSSACGFYNVYINEKKVNNDFYNPGFTDYRKRIQYQTYDVTDNIKQGQNVIGATVAKGYYTGYVGYTPNPMVYGSKNTFIGKLVIHYADDTEDIIVTDNTWQFTDKGASISADYQQGENYDARLEFDLNNLSDKRWISCGVNDWNNDVIPTNGELLGERFELSAQIGDGAKIEREIIPTVPEKTNGHFIYDFGQNMVGTVRIRVKGEKGQSIKLRYGEMCRKSGELYVANLRTAANTDTYTLKGDKTGEVFIPSFTSHGFRYVEVSGNGDTLNENPVISIEGLVITNTSEKTGSFECSNDAVNKLYNNIVWGQRGNSLLVYTDCPQRNERMGWTGDGQVFAKTAAYNMHVKAFMDKWLLDMRDGQLLYNKNGAVPDTAPLGGDNRLDGCAGWGDAAVIIPWQMYRAYGDINVLKDNYDMMKKWVDYQSRSDRQNYGIRIVDGEEVINKSDLASIPYIQVQQRRGDHLAFDESTPFILSATAYAAHISEILADTAKLLGKTADENIYRTRYKNIKQAFNEAWVQRDGSIAYWGEMSKSSKDKNGNIINKTYYSDTSISFPSQTAYALAIDFGLIPKEKMSYAAKCLKKSIDIQGGKLSVGFLGISHLVSSLIKAELTETAFALLEQTQNPSWLYSVKNGATTIWERWNSYIAETDTFGDTAMNSFNHYAYGAIGEWLMGGILGINPDEAGYKSIILKPTFGGSLTYAKGSYNSIYGEITSEWKLNKNKFIYRCKIPANTTATLYLPSNDKAINLSSGSYKFEVLL